MNKEYFNRIKKTDHNSELYYSKYESEDGVLSLPKHRYNVINLIKYELEKYLNRNKVHSWKYNCIFKIISLNEFKDHIFIVLVLFIVGSLVIAFLSNV